MAHKYTVDPAARALLVDMGISPANVLRRAQLPADLLNRGAVSLPEAEYFAFWHAIEDEADDPNLPVRIAEVISPVVFDPPIFAGLVSTDLNTAATRIARYKKLIGPMRLDVRIDDDETTIGYVWPTGVTPPQSLVLAELLFWVALARIGTRHRIDPLRVAAPEPPPESDAYVGYMGVPVGRGAMPTVTFSARDASRPFLTANESMWETFEPALRRRLSELEADATTEDRVRAVLLELLPAGESSMDAAAAQLAMSTRTLHRRLQGEGTTYQHVLNDTREALARHYLTNPNLSAGEISFLLGYVEPSSFYRAFHNWTGETPERVRAGAT